MENIKDKTGLIRSLEISLSLCDKRSLNRFKFAKKSLNVKEVVSKAGLSKALLTELLNDHIICRLHYGSEFCENLIPSSSELEYMAEETAAVGIKLNLVTPLATDLGLKKLQKLFCQLPPECEVIVNDWGVLRLLRNEFPSLAAIAGRQLCKMIKDPRLPSLQWARATPPTFSSSFLCILKKFGINRIELDIPPYVEPADFKINDMNVSVHVPYGFVFKSRVCRIGSSHQSKNDKFIPGHACERECLTYICEMKRSPPLKDGELLSFERGNTMFYRHSQEMTDILFNAIEYGSINRIILAGDWNENSYANQSL